MPRRLGHTAGDKIQLFRVLFPSWRFFDRLGDTPQLYSRTAPEGRELGDWSPSVHPTAFVHPDAVLIGDVSLLDGIQ